MLTFMMAARFKIITFWKTSISATSSMAHLVCLTAHTLTDCVTKLLTDVAALGVVTQFGAMMSHVHDWSRNRSNFSHTACVPDVQAQMYRTW